MDERQMILVVLFGLFSWDLCSISASMLETIVRPGDNITLYCDCRSSTGVYIVWFRNCSHQHQPTLEVKTINKDNILEKAHPRFTFLKNQSSDSYDLLIINVTDSDEGLYYCGTIEPKGIENVYVYGNITTRIKLWSGFLHQNISRPVEECGSCWKLLFSVCPAVSLLSALFSSLLVYLLCLKKANNEAENKRCDISRQTEGAQDENVCYAALEIHPPSQRTKRKRTIQSSDFSTYSAIKT
ncbi:uncharacterized protein LOC119796221 isoform X2 [Cyprinodon tularosa]|uniref:uncharacterized protein LOC119796221 isoform X2 n=1 Tax=Cyprinodon tularosa TaxID=77115 RepID=UPI0018E20767|nr:uncharacterized protein LOC119796221 isoform X2 [Cyprinodon tularosa]